MADVDIDGERYSQLDFLNIREQLRINGVPVTPGDGSEPLTTYKFVDRGTAATTRDGSIENPYNDITEALAAITDAATGKRYVLIVVPGNYTNFTAKPFIFIIASEKQTVITGTMTIPDTAGVYYFEGMVAGNSPTANMTATADINYRDCLILASSLAFDLGGTSGTTLNYESCTFNGKMDFRQLPASFRDCVINNMEFLDFTLTSFPYDFIGCTFKGDLTSSGSTSFNPFKFLNSDWQSGSTLTAAWTFTVSADSSFPFEGNTNVSIVDRRSKSVMVDYDNTVSGMVADNVEDALDELKLTSGLPNEFIVTSLQDILDIPGVAQTLNDIDVTALGSFTLKPRGLVDISPNRLVCLGDTTNIILIEGQNQANDIMITSHPGEMFSFEDCTVLVRWMNVFATSAVNGVFNISNTAGNEKTGNFQMFNTFINNSIGGTFKDLATVSIFLPSFLGNTSDGFSFSGAFTRAAIQDIQFENYTGTAIDLGTATFDSVAILASTDLPTVSNVFLSGAANSANLNAGGQGVISNIRFEGTQSPTINNILASDLQWDFNNSPPLIDSFSAGFFNLTTTALTAVPLQNTYVKIAGTTVAFSGNSRLTQTDNNEFQWDSLTPKPIVISAQVSFTKAGAAEEYEITVFKEPSGGGGFSIIDADITGCAEIKSTTVQFDVTVPDTPSPGDKYSVFIQCTSSASADLTAICMQVEIR